MASDDLVRRFRLEMADTLNGVPFATTSEDPNGGWVKHIAHSLVMLKKDQKIERLERELAVAREQAQADRAFQTENAQLKSELAEALGAKDGAYSERDKLVALLSSCFPSWLERHPDEDESWEDDWRWIVFINLPTGQASWHIHDSELEWFSGRLHTRASGSWDGHTTEEKYQRVIDAAKEPNDGE